ncbi:hypothetical protein ElyMa_004111900, partial [Elysia marginata]
AAKDQDKDALHNLPLIRNKTKSSIPPVIDNRRRAQHFGHVPNDSIYSLPRRDQIIILRIETGHNKLSHQTHSRLKVGDSSGCPCGTPSNDACANHILHDSVCLTRQGTGCGEADILCVRSCTANHWLWR